MADSEKPLYVEHQHFQQWWVWLAVLLGAAVCWAAFVVQILMGRPFGDNPGPDWLVWVLLLLIGLGMPLFFRYLRLSVTVYTDQVLVHFRPLRRRAIKFDEILTCIEREYRPIREYGGWGIRWSPSHGMAYNISGHRGVQLELRDGKKLLIGSQRSVELAAAIRRQL
jgi:hypothetical protein